MGELSRYRFSRSVCRRMDLLSVSTDDQEGGDPTLSPRGNKKSLFTAPSSSSPPAPSPLPVRSQSDRRYSLAKASYSKSMSGPLSALGSDDGKCASIACGDCEQPQQPQQQQQQQQQPKRVLQRLVSWSRYLEPRGDEQAVETAEEWMIDLSKLLLGQRFAAGAHSRLYHGIYQGKAVAVKVIRHPKACDKNSSLVSGQLKSTLDLLFSREVSLLSRLRHPNVVQVRVTSDMLPHFRHAQLIGAWKRPPVCCVVTEYLSGGSLQDFLRGSSSSSTSTALPVRTIVDMALDIARGIRYLHSQGVVHRDIKSANLILDDEFGIKITDFGVAAVETECGHSVTSDVGTYRWMAPELVNRKAHTRKVDAYSFGIVLWELLTRKIPFEDMTPVQAAFAVVNKNARPELPHDCPPFLSQLMRSCWSQHPEGRPDFEEIVTTLEGFEGEPHLNGSCKT